MLRDKLIWDGFALIGIVALTETTSYLTYCPSDRVMRLKGWSFLLRVTDTTFNWRVINSFKVGFLLGFFVDAFKVGS